jgi:hypothetical protein
MGEKGFLVGCTSRTRRIFSKPLWQQKRVTQGLQDGNRERVTILATICADGSALDPAVIFEGNRPLRSSWGHCKSYPQKESKERAIVRSTASGEPQAAVVGAPVIQLRRGRVIHTPKRYL